VTVKDS